MHPLVFVAAGLAVPLVRHLFKGARNDRGMWSELERATGGQRGWHEGAECLELADGVRFSLHARSGPKRFEIEGPCDVLDLPAFRLEPFDGGPHDLRRDQVLVEPDLACGEASRETVEAFLAPGLRRQLRDLEGALFSHRPPQLRLSWQRHGLSADVVPPATLIRGIRLMSTLIRVGDALLLPLDRVTGVTHEGSQRVLPGGVRLTPSWLGGPGVRASIQAEDVDAAPFRAQWQAGKRTGPHGHIESPPLTDAQLVFDGVELALTAPLDPPGAVLEHAAYLQRLARTLRKTSSPFR